jgi:hypothetical protein
MSIATDGWAPEPSWDKGFPITAITRDDGDHGDL